MKPDRPKKPSRPKALDLYCCAGGAAMGLHRAGYDVTGVDIEPQPHYPFAFVQGDALEADLSGYDFVWASPPCQHHSRMSGCREGLRDKYPDLIAATREKLQAWGGPWIIENVVGAPLRNPVMLCGAMFGLQTYRHRIFESNVSLTAPPHPKHDKPTSKAGHWKPGTLISVAGNCAPMALAREAMGIDWMPRSNLVEAIPPAFAEYLARQTLRVTARLNYEKAIEWDIPTETVGDLLDSMETGQFRIDRDALEDIAGTERQTPPNDQGD